MKFSTSMDSMARQNSHLKWLVNGLVLIVTCLSTLNLLMFDKDPIYLERSTRGLEVLRITPVKRSPQDLEQAVNLMLKARFETDAVSTDLFLSLRQVQLRESEQRDLKSRGLTQKIVFRGLKVVQGEMPGEIRGEMIAEFDRVLATLEIRSAIKTELKIAFEQVSPNELNPYGLKLALSEPIQKSEVSK